LRFFEESSIGFHSHGVDGDIGTTALGHGVDLIDQIIVFGVQRVYLVDGARLLESVFQWIDGDDTFGAVKPGSLLRHQSYRTASEDHHRITGFHLSPFHGRPSGGENVRQEKHLLVGKSVGDNLRTRIGFGYADILRLAAAVSTVQVGVAEHPAAFFLEEVSTRPVLFGIGMLTTGMKSLRAVKTLPTGDRERHDHAVALSQSGNTAT